MRRIALCVGLAAVSLVLASQAAAATKGFACTGTLGSGSVAGDEYLRNMTDARVRADGSARWVEVCFCDTPLEEERPYWEEYFELLKVQDAHSRKNCRHENGTEPWACGPAGWDCA